MAGSLGGGRRFITCIMYSVVHLSIQAFVNFPLALLQNDSILIQKKKMMKI